MKYKSLLLVLVWLALLCASCKKDHYNVNHLQGVNAEGEVLLPIGSASLSLMDMMQKFKIDSLILCSPEGNLSYGYYYEDFGVINGNDLLRFKDLDYSEHFSIENEFSLVLPQAIDTMFHFEQSLVFEADHISVLEAEMKSGHFDFELASNIGLLNRVVLHTPDIKDASGHDLVLDFPFNTGAIGFDMDGLHYETDSANKLNLEYDLYFHVQEIPGQELYFDVDIKGRDLAFREMRGFVETYDSRNYIDTTFTLFPDKVSGSLDVKGARLKLFERNTFGLEARLIVDTAWLYGEDLEPYSIFNTMPLSVEVPIQDEFGEVYDATLHGTIMAKGGDLFTASSFIVNPYGLDQMVSVTDSCTIDVKVDANIPFAFTANDVRYLDTVVMENSEINSPEAIEKLTLELTINSTLPLNLDAEFYVYDSETERITDTLIADDSLIKASFDGRPATTTISLEITKDRLENYLKSDRLLMLYKIDTDAREVTLNANQKLDLYLKARVKYDGVFEF